MNALERRCIEISYRRKLSHLSSVLNAVNVIDEIYTVRYANEPFVLGCSQAALGLWVVLEKHRLCNADEMVERYGTHAERDMAHGVFVSGGSLGQAETVAAGMALADRSRRVFLLTSDGACAEGSVWEALRLARDLALKNLVVTVICNGYSAYQAVDSKDLIHQLDAVFPCHISYGSQQRYPGYLQGISAHYHVLSDDEVKELLA